MESWLKQVWVATRPESTNQLLPRNGIELPATPPGDTPFAATPPDQARTLALLHDIGKELTSILDLEPLLRAVGERVKQLVDYDLFGVMLLNHETRRLEHTFSLRYDQRVHLSTTLGIGEGLCGTAARERKPVRVGRVGTDPRYVRCEAGIGIESELVVPLIVKDRLLGVMDLESLRRDAFTQDHEQLLATLASTVAIALENARLYDQLLRAEQRRKEDLERARDVQQLLLPTEMPELPGIEIGVHYLPAQELGGDFYDFLPYGDGRIAIAVGDVAGKGSAAALLASLGIGILREHAVRSPSRPAEMLADLNGHLQVTGRDGCFIAMALALFEPARGELYLANAGFPLPLLVRDKRVTPLAVTGVPLGLLPDSTYDSLCVRLQPADVLILCSDGVHEQTNALDEPFDLARHVAHLAATQPRASAECITAEIVRAIEEHAGGAAACRDCTDDRTIVVLRVSGEPPA